MLQEIAPGLIVIDPAAPDAEALRRSLGGGIGGLLPGGPNVAVTDVSVDGVTEQKMENSEHPPPLQPKNTDPFVGVALSSTEAVFTNDAEHAEPQDKPDGLLTTVPVPAPAKDTETVL
jgi:hypothetical protein